MEPMKPMKPMEPMKPMAPMKPMSGGDAWWPKDLGEPSSSGAQNDTRYAYFEKAQRLAVKNGSNVTVYDTGSRRINGFGQQQGQGNSMQFSTDSGAVDLSELQVVK